jgi:antirestriction protein ArdC
MMGPKSWNHNNHDQAPLLSTETSSQKYRAICADLGITPETRDDHAAYIASWLKVLKDDKRAIFIAASHAQKAADYLHGLQPQTGTASAAMQAAA